MSLVPRRLKSIAVSAATDRIAQSLLSKAGDVPTVREQLLDANQLQRLSLTLNRPNLYSDCSVHATSPANGTPIPPGHHLAYFTPAALPNELGIDGTDVAYSPGKPFTRCMWVGGEVSWDKENRLRVGENVTETTQLLSAVPKRTRTGEEMIVVGVQKIFENHKGIVLIDKRNWVFRMELVQAQAVQDANVHTPIPLPAAPHPTVKIRDFIQTPASLFRFSALTFNAHKIHYSRPWCREVEGHRDIVVHGPLNLINMLDFWRDTRKNGNYEVPKSIRYRATAPFYCGEQYRALLEEGEKSSAHVKLWGSDGKGDVRVGMLGDIVATSE